MPEQQQTLTIQQAIDLAVQHHKEGRLSQAETIYNQILQANPNHPVVLHLLGVVAHQVGNNDTAVDLITKAIALQPDYAEANNNLGLALQDLGRLDEAVASYHKALALIPDYPEAHNNLGNTLRSLGRPEDAMASYQKARDLKPDYIEAHNNFGTALQDLGRPEEAEASYRKALALYPDYTDAHNNLGITLRSLGRLEDAMASYRKALDLKPDYAEVHNNLGTVLQGLGRPEEAEASYHKALALYPDYTDAHNNLGNTLRSLGRLEDAIASYQKALDLKPDYVEVHNNLGTTFQDWGQLEKAVISFQKALAIKPDFFQGLNDLGNTLRNLGHLDEAVASYRKALAIEPNYARTHTNLDKERQAESQNPAPNSNSLEDIIALLTVGRSGSLLFHSLFDGHPDIATLPSIYFQGYFGSKVWQHIYGDPDNPRWREIATTAVVKHFDPLFDAQSEQPLFGNILLHSDSVGSTTGVGRNTGCTAMGDARDQVLTLDRITFSKYLLNFLSEHNQLDPKLLFKLIHLAFEKTLDRGIIPKNIFYHIHNPTPSELANFLAAFPRTRFLITIREPVQSLESWVALCTHRPKVTNPDHGKDLQHRLLESEYLNLVKVLTSVHDQLSITPFLCFDSAAVRLEDIKLQAKGLMPQVAKWIGIPDHPSLYQSTFQGLTYWGPYSPLNPQIKGFDPKSIRRKTGIIFSNKDIWIFSTLFYYFRTHYGYQDKDEKTFRTDLRKIRDLLDEPFDFEYQWVQKQSNGIWKPQDLFPFQVLRNKIKSIWQLVDQQKTFYGMPNLITPKFK